MAQFSALLGSTSAGSRAEQELEGEAVAAQRVERRQRVEARSGGGTTAQRKRGAGTAALGRSGCRRLGRATWGLAAR